MLENFMAQLSKELEMETPFEAQIPGTYTFQLEFNAIEIKEIQPSGFSFTCNLGPVPKTNLETFFSDLLGANLLGQTTRGSILGLDEEGENIRLTRTITYHVEYAQFRDLLEDFANVAEFWHDEALAQK